MFRILIAITSLLAVFGFAPSARVARSASLQMISASEIGALPPVGFWDPLGLSKDIDEETFNKYREAEQKHGRVAMLAVVGYLVQEVYRFPGNLDGTIPFASITNGVGAIGEIPSLGWLQIVGSIGYWELVGWEDKRPEVSEMGTIGDVGFYTSLPATDAQKREYLTKELQNGRLAMLGIMELITHDIAKPVGESLFTIHHL